MTSTEIRERISQIGLRRSLIFPAAEIYGTLGGFYDFGPMGTAIKHRIQDLWRKYFIKKNGFLEIETSLIVPEIVVKASGHLDHFSDPVTTCKLCGSKFRADHLLEENELHVEGKTIDEINKMIKESKIICPNCKKEGFSEVTFQNLMFKTNIGPTGGVPGYGRPETAQGIMLDFSRIYRTYGKLPLAIGQIGKSLRNEISPRQGVIRLREFTQMELEYFFDPQEPKFSKFKEMENKKIAIVTQSSQEKEGKKDAKPTILTCQDAVDQKIVPNEILSYFLGATTAFYEECGIPFAEMHFRQLLPNEMPHYSGGNFDLEVHTSYGWIETVGIAYRTDFDLKSHMETSGKDLTVVMPDGRRIIPHVVEPSFGVDRLFWTILEHAYRKGEDRGWEWLDLPLELSPYGVAVFPLMKKDGLAEKAHEITDMLRGSNISALYDESGSIGKRYARADEVGIKWAVTIDYDTLKDGTVTIRDRNTTKQERIKISDIVLSIK